MPSQAEQAAAAEKAPVALRGVRGFRRSFEIGSLFDVCLETCFICGLMVYEVCSKSLYFMSLLVNI